MKKTFLTFAFAIALLFLFSACPRGKTDDINGGNLNKHQPQWQTITAEEARWIMETSEDNYILLDVRTEAEYQEVRIAGAILIPDNEIKNRAEKELPDKNALILVYCRSGRRSAASAAVLAGLGYTNIYDFGGILNWPYETISGK
jgi:rhodanese-related sulfurtransferase